MLYPYRRRDVTCAADRILADLLRANRGVPALTFRAAWRLAHRYGLRCRPVFSCPDFEADLCETTPDRWTIYYNGDHSERRRIRYIIHEIAEYLCLQTLLAGLFDGIPGSRTARYDGGDSPGNVRHRVALLAERMYAKLIKLEKQRRDL